MIRIYYLLISVIFCLAGCNVAQKFEDVSSAATYNNYVGVEYVLNVEMHLSGVNAPPGYEESIDYYVVNPATPSWSGPELITRETLPVGTVVRVQSVQRCTNCLSAQRLRATITLTGRAPRDDRPVHISLEFLNGEFASRL